jgi:tape measure domain-containing protein
MAGELERLLIRLEADTTALRRELRNADREVGNFSDRADKRAAAVSRSFKTMLAGFSTAYLVREASKLSDEFTRMNNRLAVVARSSGDLEHVQRRLMQIAQEARVDVSATADIYSRYAFALKDAGVTTNEVLQFTEALSKAVVISGASSSEAAGALLQLSQGLAAGVLRGQELNSVMEQMPIVADAIARQLGVTTGQLKKMGEQGLITRDIVVNAVNNSLTELNEKFGKVAPTIEQGFTQLGNSTLEFVGRLSEATGVGNALAEALGSVAGSIAKANEELKTTGTLSIWEQIKNVPQWIVDRVSMKPVGAGQGVSAAPGLGMMGAGVGLEGNIRPPKNEGTMTGDPWNTTIIPPTFEEEMSWMKEQWAELHEAQMLALDDLLGDHTETAAAKMAALTEAVKAGAIGWQDYGKMKERVDRQVERSQQALLSGTAQFLDSMFEGNKTAAIASALINTYQGITKALSSAAPPYSYALAAMTAAQGFAQVKAIRSTSKNSTGGGAASTGGAASAGATAAAPSQDRVLHVQLASLGDMLGRQGIRSLMEKIQEANNDGYRLRLA